MKDKLIISGLVVLMIANVLGLFKVQPKLQGQFDTAKFLCTVATSTQMVIGKDIPTFVAATSSGRAFFSLESPSQATTTIAFAFNGKVATTGTNFLLPNGPGYSKIIGATASTSVFKAGLDTDFHYVGAISAISLQGTSTVLVTECKY